MGNGRRPGWAWIIALALAILLAGCSRGDRGGATTPIASQLAAPGDATAANAATGAQAAATPGDGGLTGGVPDIIAVANAVKPATVLVQNLGGPGGGAAPGQPQGGVPQGAGTGFIYDPAGYIITNNHVVEGAQRLRVVLPPPDNRQFDAQLIGTDPLTDLALLKIDGEDLPTVPLGNSERLQVGQWVVAIGNAFALPGGPTVTVGVVSALGRDIQEPGQGGQGGGAQLYDLIQTDAAINPGNSGGPLVNLNGEVIGVNTLGTSQGQNIGFAIAIDTTKQIVEQLRRDGQVTRGYLGVRLQNVTPSVAAALGLSRNDGVAVVQVEPGSPSAAAGLQRGDVIIGIGDVAVRSQADLQQALTERFRPGQTVEVRIVRGGSEQTVSVTLGDRSAQ